MKSYEIIPNGRKSSYGKALALVDNNGNEALFSYDTMVMKKVGDQFYRYTDFLLSHTTCSHILAFSGLHKKDFLKLPVAM